MRTDCERRSSCGVCKNRYGITYNKTLLREHGWELPNSFAELEQTVERFRVTPENK